MDFPIVLKHYSSSELYNKGESGWYSHETGHCQSPLPGFISRLETGYCQSPLPGFISRLEITFGLKFLLVLIPIPRVLF